MKVTSVLLNIKEEDYDLYLEELTRLGWKKIGDRSVYRKKVGETEVEVKEHIPTFSGNVYLTVSARNQEGIKSSTIDDILRELKEADRTPDDQ